MPTKEEMKKVYDKIFTALDGLNYADAILALEAAKLDIMLNKNIVILDKTMGGVSNLGGINAPQAPREDLLKCEHDFEINLEKRIIFCKKCGLTKKLEE